MNRLECEDEEDYKEEPLLSLDFLLEEEWEEDEDDLAPQQTIKVEKDPLETNAVTVSRSRAKPSELTAEEKEAKRKKRHECYIRQRQRLLEKTPEEREELLRKRRERRRETGKKKLKSGNDNGGKSRKGWNTKKAFAERVRVKLKAQGGLTEEEIEKQVEEELNKRGEKLSFQRFVRHHTRNEEQIERDRLNKYFNFHSKPEFEKEKIRKRTNKYYHEVIKKDPKKLNRFRAQLRSYARKRGYKVDSEKLKEYKKAQTPEQRVKTLLGYKVNQAKQKLKKKLLAEGISQEEIQIRLKELAKEMWSQPLPPIESISVYKPMPQRAPKNPGRKCIDITQLPVPPPATVSSSNQPVSTLEEEEKSESESNLGTEFQQEPLSVEAPGDSAASSCAEDQTLFPVPSPDYAQEDFDEGHEAEAYLPSNEDSLSQQEIVSTQCPQCSETFLSDSILREHVFSSHPKNCWKCPICKEVMLSSSELSEHFRIKHATKDTGIKTVAEHSPSSSVSIPPEPEISKPLLFSCIKCTGTFKNEFSTDQELKAHVKLQHPEFFFICPQCDILKYSEKSLNFHVKCHKQILRKNKSTKR